MVERTIEIRVVEERDGTWRLTATLSAPHRGARGVKHVPFKTITHKMRHPYINILTPALLTEWTTALTLVAAGFYEPEPLPLDLGDGEAL